MVNRSGLAIGDKKRAKKISLHSVDFRERAKPSGLRSRKKARQHVELINVAVKLFGANGYENVRMDDIGAAAGVSTKTVYNYFRTKRDILIEFLIRDREKVVAKYQKIFDSPSGDITDDLIRIMMADISDVSCPGQKALWLEIMAVTVQTRGDERFQRYRWMFTSNLERLLIGFRDRGKLSSSLDTKLAADMIHTIHSESFVRYCATTNLTVTDALLLARRQLDLLLVSWR